MVVEDLVKNSEETGRLELDTEDCGEGPIQPFIEEIVQKASGNSTEALLKRLSSNSIVLCPAGCNANGQYIDGNFIVEASAGDREIINLLLGREVKCNESLKNEAVFRLRTLGVNTEVLQT